MIRYKKEFKQSLVDMHNQGRLQHQSWDLWLPPHRRIFTVHFEH